MSTIDNILGRTPVQEDSPPAQAARPHVAFPARKEPPKDKENKTLRDKARSSHVVASIIGVAENNEEAIIPNNAKRVDAFSAAQIPGVADVPTISSESPSEPAITGTHDEELMPPTAALVAPDVTPKVFQLIDPSQVPAPPQPSNVPPPPASAGPATSPENGALDTILGRNQNPTPVPSVTAESFMQTIDSSTVKSKVAEKLIPAKDGGSSMPVHQEGDGRAIYSTFRRLVG